MKEKVNPPPETADDAALARALFEKGVLDEADVEVENETAPLEILFADFRAESI